MESNLVDHEHGAFGRGRALENIDNVGKAGRPGCQLRSPPRPCRTRARGDYHDVGPLANDGCERRLGTEPELDVELSRLDQLVAHEIAELGTVRDRGRQAYLAARLGGLLKDQDLMTRDGGSDSRLQAGRAYAGDHDPPPSPDDRPPALGVRATLGPRPGCAGAPRAQGALRLRARSWGSRCIRASG